MIAKLAEIIDTQTVIITVTVLLLCTMFSFGYVNTHKADINTTTALITDPVEKKEKRLSVISSPEKLQELSRKREFDDDEDTEDDDDD